METKYKVFIVVTFAMVAFVAALYLYSRLNEVNASVSGVITIPGRITGLTTTTAASDAATKAYVDNAVLNAGISTSTLNAALSSISTTTNSMSANNGIYNNAIVAMNPPAAYTEVCFNGGMTNYDKRSAGVATGSGNCSVGNVGFIIEAGERSAQYWTQAKQICLQNNMRLPEPFEWQLSCNNSSTWGLSTMTTNNEWASNTALPMYNGNSAVVAAIFGGGGCNYATYGPVGANYGAGYSYSFRCAR